jgi:hypothetical protein
LAAAAAEALALEGDVEAVCDASPKDALTGVYFDRNEFSDSACRALWKVIFLGVTGADDASNSSTLLFFFFIIILSSSSLLRLLIYDFDTPCSDLNKLLLSATELIRRQQNCNSDALYLYAHTKLLFSSRRAWGGGF